MASVEDFKALVEEIEKGGDYIRPQAFGIGLAHLDSQGNTLDTYFPYPNFESNYGSAAIFAKVVGHTNGTASYDVSNTQAGEILKHFAAFENDGKKHHNIDAIKNLRKSAQKNKKTQKLIVSFIAPSSQDEGPKDVSDAYLRLHLLSHRLVKPHGINLSGIFGVLPNVAWTSAGPIALDDLDQRRVEAMENGQSLSVQSVDKFPKMTDYVVPSGVRIGDAARVRLGAYLGEGTTVMHEGFVNFNGGCEGPNMIEGRISAGVFVGKGTDLGGGCSTMGTLSGGGNVIIAIGEDCLIGANAGCGIALGDRCTIEAGLYVTAGTKVLFDGRVIKARNLSGQDDMLFLRNSQTGQVEARSRSNTVELNAQLHAN